MEIPPHIDDLLARLSRVVCSTSMRRQRVVWRIVIIRLDRKQDSRWTGETIPEYSGLILIAVGRDVMTGSMNCSTWNARQVDVCWCLYFYFPRARVWQGSRISSLLSRPRYFLTSRSTRRSLIHLGKPRKS
jgi:hypothetical protein